jgi:ribosomal protein S18 acetylase RimI-like enzyme
MPTHYWWKTSLSARESKGRGWDPALLAEVERIAGQEGRHWARLYTNEAMVENLAYYPRRGYIETHRAEVDGFSRVFFAKRIGPRSA